MRSLGFLLILVFIHTLPLWNTQKNLAGGFGDPFAHAAIPKWYCPNVPFGHLHASNFLAPGGFDLSTVYDSPFPLLLTCPFEGLGSLMQFHLFAMMQIILIVVCAWMVSRLLFKEELWQVAYCLFIWWSGYYFARSTQHFTLLSNIWGFQLLLWIFMSIRWNDWRGISGRGLLLGLVFSGSFQNAPMLFAPLVGLLIYSFVKDSSKESFLTYLQGFTLLGGASLLIFLPLYWPALYAVLQGDYISANPATSRWGLNLLSPLLPWQNNLYYTWFDEKPFLGIESTNPFDLFFMLLFVISLAFWKFWKNSLRLILLLVALCSFWFSLGGKIILGTEDLAENPFFAQVSNLLPFSLCRTPGRFAVITGMILIFIGFQFLREKIHSRKILAGLLGFLILWVAFTGPYMNQSFWVSTFQYRELFPMKGLEVLHNLPADNMVLNVPAASAQDPSQNFMWLLHEKNINAGYISYAAYTAKVMKPLAEDPLLGKLSCSGESLGFQATPFLMDMELVRQKLQELHAGGMIFNKMFMRFPACKELANWIVLLTKQKWVSAIEENNNYLVLKF